MTKRKPDIADRIAEGIYPEGTIDHAMLRMHLARRIRRAINAAVKADRKRRTER